MNIKCCNNCGVDATHYVDWPGQGRKAMCTDHARKARIVAQGLGFTLTFEAIEPVRPILKVTQSQHDKLEEWIPSVWKLALPDGRLLIPITGIPMGLWPALEIVDVSAI